MAREEHGPETRIALVEQRVDQHDETFRGIRKTLDSIDQTLQKIHHIESSNHEHNAALGRAFSRIETIEGAVDQIKQEMPTLKMSRRAIFGVLGMGGLGALTLVIAAVRMATG